MKGTPGAAVKLLSCDHEVMGSNPGNNLFRKCRKKLRKNNVYTSNASQSRDRIYLMRKHHTQAGESTVFVSASKKG
jgi:hypothetical protein